MHSYQNVRKDVVHGVLGLGFRHGLVRRTSSTRVEVIIVCGAGIPVDLSLLSRYFGTHWTVTQEEFTVEDECTDVDIVGLLENPFYIVKSAESESNDLSDDNFDHRSSDDGGWEINSTGKPFRN